MLICFEILKREINNSGKKYVSFTIKHVAILKDITLGFPGGAVVKNPPASAGDRGSIPGPGRSHTPRSN